MSEGVPAELRAKTPGRMQSVERRGPGERDISLAQPLELPLELIQLILKQVDSLRTLVIASSVCRAFQHEAECLLYRTVHVCQVPQIRSLHHALTQFPMRASFVHTFELEGEWLELQGVVPHLSRILLLLTHLDVLKLSSTAFFTDWDFCVAMLSTLAKCPFRLRLFTSRVFYSPELLRFLGQQTGLESLHVADLSYYVYSDDGAISPTILPNVKYLRTDHTFFLRTITTAHAITHLDLNLTDRDHQPLDAVLKILEHQLISLKCNLFSFHLRRPAGCILSDLINQRPMPNLRYLEVKDVLPSLVVCVYVFPCHLSDYSPRSSSHSQPLIICTWARKTPH
ncbi:uncharacterized protein B0H18DRAFT_1035254 [Fomitopsis serialis]|uniref:uncharacterized protein n=1 Tax=Fomitopsis serialis TaxID=139415 RepID=UPI002007B949|nr:uncharacterized protein B0H18DRAFT_1035254 [Neoantrodia serialis]KAH9917255.1 hypothetical protein B0H18DRAFT_1035254 [Neoantrodia serialis]